MKPEELFFKSYINVFAKNEHVNRWYEEEDVIDRLKKEHSYDGVIDIKKGDFIVVNNDFFILKVLF